MATTRIQAEDFDGDDGSNVAGVIAATLDTGGGDGLINIWTTQDWYYSLSLGSDEVDTIRIRYACAGWQVALSPPPTYLFRTGSYSGTQVGSFALQDTGHHVNTYLTSADITLDPALTGDVDLWFCFTINGGGTNGSCLNWWEYDTADITEITATAVAAPAAVPQSGWATRNSLIVMGGTSKSGTWS